jgi:Aldehyde dehydrogenase family
LIGGKWVESASGEWLEVEDPAHRRPIAEVPRGRAEDVARAVKAAADAFPAWSRVVPRERGRLLARIADALEARVEELARTIALETGNALRTQARPEAKTTIDIIRYFGGLGGELKGETIPFGEHVLSYTRREPLGVVGAIIPWNAPVLLAALKIGPALCAGNTLVLKAAEDAPLGVLLLAEVCQEFLPPGVLNVLTGLGEECGAPLASHPMVSKLSFTGSTEVGKLIMRAASERVVPVSLELGGKSPSIVFPDANEDWVVDGIIAAMRFTRQSQSCTAGSRLFLHRDIFDNFLDALGRKVKALKLGDPLVTGTGVAHSNHDVVACGWFFRLFRRPQRQFFVLAKKLSNVVLDFKTGMHRRPIMRSSNEGEKREETFEASATKRLPQDLSRPFGLRWFNENQRAKRKSSILELRVRSGPVHWLPDLSQRFVDRFKLSPPRRSYPEKLHQLFDRLRGGRGVA